MTDPCQEHWTVPYEPDDIDFWSVMAGVALGAMVVVAWMGR